MRPNNLIEGYKIVSVVSYLKYISTRSNVLPVSVFPKVDWMLPFEHLHSGPTSKGPTNEKKDESRHHTVKFPGLLIKHCWGKVDPSCLQSPWISFFGKSDLTWTELDWCKVSGVFHLKHWNDVENQAKETIAKIEGNHDYHWLVLHS